MNRSPSETESGILDTLVRYFKKTMPVHEAVGRRAVCGGAPVQDPTGIAEKLDAFLRGGLHGAVPNQAGLLQEQYVEQIVPYAMSDRTLADIGLEPHVANAFARYVVGPKTSGNTAHPYEHQEKAFIALKSGKKRHAIICSGTGSGKTESFLMPVIDGIVRDKLANPERKGIRALILYPMNALVEDQIRRIRGIIHELVKETSGDSPLPASAVPTFGSFTGRLEHRYIKDEDDAEELFNPCLAVEKLVDGNGRLSLERNASDEELSSLGAVVDVREQGEFRDREEYSDGGPDILITNTSMLQRLLLRPDMDCLFRPYADDASTWKYIVLDEAHSYTGASGTEIAWLVRRLVHRIQGNNAEGAKKIRDGIHFLATSATLYKRRMAEDPSKDTPEAAAERLELDKADTAKGFGVRIFPIKDWCDIDVEFGRQLEVDDVCETTPLYLESKRFADLISFVEKDKSPDALFDRTVACMARRENLKRQNGLCAFLRRRFGDFSGADTCNLAEAAAIVSRIKGPDLDSFANTKDVVLVDDAVKRLVSFVLSYFGHDPHNEKSPWRVMLHDPLDKSKGDEFNRREIFDKWLRIERENGVQGYLKGYEVAYLCAAVVEASSAISRPGSLEAVGEAFPNAINEIRSLSDVLMMVSVHLARPLLDELSSFVRRIDQESRVCVAEYEDILGDWERLLGERMQRDSAGAESLENYFHRVFSGRKDVRALYERLKSGFCSVSELSRIIGGDSNELFALLQICLIATKRGLRAPVINSRYHQMVRGVWDVAVRFPTGRLESLEIVRSPANTLDDEHPEAGLFTLGVCRECGQPFLIGYTDQDIVDGSPRFLMRSESPTYGLMHAFAWVRGADEVALTNQDQEQCPRDDDDCRMVVNLLTTEAMTWHDFEAGRSCGRISDADVAACVEMEWHRVAATKTGPDDAPVSLRSSFVEECPNCRRKQNRKQHLTQKFGTITPYQAFDQQVKIELLEEFVSKSLADPDPAIAALPGHGKKVLAFSDSRNQASTFSQKFDEAYYNKYFISAINAIVRQERQVDQDEVEELKKEIDSLVQDISSCVNPRKRERLQRDLGARNAELDELTAGGETGKRLGDVADELKAKMEEHQLLDMLIQKKLAADAYGDPLEWSESARLTVLMMLKDFGRAALLVRRLVRLRYDNVSKVAEYFRSYCGAADGLEEAQLRTVHENIEPLLNEIYEWIVRKVLLLPGRNRTDRVWLPSRSQGRAKCLLNVPPRAPRGDDRDGEYCNFTGVKGLKSLVSRYFRDWGIMVADKKVADTCVQRILGYVYSSLIDARILNVIQDDAQAYGVSVDTIVEHTVLVPGDGTARGAEADEAVDSLIEEADLIRIEEHTAQISPLLGEAYQRGFSSGRINALSCSTTFEMGVDVGALSRVMMMNVPPLTANYRQRAGRAGRRPGAAAYILTFAQNNPTENHFFDEPSDMYDGKMDPPEVYLKVKPFWSRQIRTSALHDFLYWWQYEANPNHRRSESDWNSTKRFFVGEKDKNGNLTHDAVVKDIARWIGTPSAQASDASSRRLIQENLSADELSQIGVNDPERDIHSASADLLVQMLGIGDQNPKEGILPYPLVKDNYIRYEELSGPFLPNIDGDRLVPDESELRKSAMERVSVKHSDPQMTRRDLNQYDGEEAIKRFGDFNIVPLNGFPVDVVRAVSSVEANAAVRRRADNRYSVRLERSLEQGLYEYAPGRVVRANKQNLQIDGYNVERGSGEDVYVCQGTGCCGEVFRAAAHAEQLHDGDRCPVCLRGKLCKRQAERPKEFLYKVVDRAEEGMQGDRHKEFCGKLRAPVKHHHLNLFVSEPDTMMMRYYNTAPDGNGFMRSGHAVSRVGGMGTVGQRRVLYHSTMTNIVIWALPSIRRSPPFVHDDVRALNALHSAASAIRRAAARVLHVNDRDVDVILKRDYVVRQNVEGYVDALGGYPDCIVLFDVAKGGGGAILPLTPLAEGFEEKTSEVLSEAIRLCEACECGGNSSLHPERTPVKRAEWNNKCRDLRGQPEDVRELCSCPNCLRAVSNVRLEGLDRLDALAVLKLIRGDVAVPRHAEVAVGAGESVSTDIPEANLRAAYFREYLASAGGDLEEADRRWLEELAAKTLPLPIPEERGEIVGLPDCTAEFVWPERKIALFMSDQKEDMKRLADYGHGWRMFSTDNAVSAILAAFKEEA